MNELIIVDDLFVPVVTLPAQTFETNDQGCQGCGGGHPFYNHKREKWNYIVSADWEISKDHYAYKVNL